MWELYKTLKAGITNQPKEHMVDEIISIMHNIDVESFKKSIHIMFGRDDFDNPLEAAILFTKGIKFNKLFSFVEFVEKLSGR